MSTAEEAKSEKEWGAYILAAELEDGGQPSKAVVMAIAKCFIKNNLKRSRDGECIKMENFKTNGLEPLELLQAGQE